MATTQNDRELLSVLAEHRILTTRQLVMLTDRNLRATERRLKELAKLGLVQSEPMLVWSKPPSGRAEPVFLTYAR